MILAFSFTLIQWLKSSCLTLSIMINPLAICTHFFSSKIYSVSLLLLHTKVSFPRSTVSTITPSYNSLFTLILTFLILHNSFLKKISPSATLIVTSYCRQLARYLQKIEASMIISIISFSTWGVFRCLLIITTLFLPHSFLLIFLIFLAKPYSCSADSVSSLISAANSSRLKSSYLCH